MTGPGLGGDGASSKVMSDLEVSLGMTDGEKHIPLS